MTYETFEVGCTYEGATAVVYQPVPRTRSGRECNESTRIWIFPDTNLDD
jgi:hypothetical protein